MLFYGTEAVLKRIVFVLSCCRFWAVCIGAMISCGFTSDFGAFRSSLPVVQAFCLLGSGELTSEIKLTSITSQLTLLTLHFPQLRILWSK